MDFKEEGPLAKTRRLKINHEVSHCLLGRIDFRRGGPFFSRTSRQANPSNFDGREERHPGLQVVVEELSFTTHGSLLLNCSPLQPSKSFHARDRAVSRTWPHSFACCGW